MSAFKAIRLILLVGVLVGSAFYHFQTSLTSKSYDVTVVSKWQSESCGKHSCNQNYKIKYKVNDTGYISTMDVTQNDYAGFTEGSVASYTLSKEDAYDVPFSYYIKSFLSICVLACFGLFLFVISIGYIVILWGSIIDWEFDIDDFKFWNWSL